MTKRMEVYFTSEDDAVSAEASLQQFRISNTFIDTLTDPDEDRVFLPLNALGANSSGMATSGLGGTGLPGFGPVNIDAAAYSDDMLVKNDEPMTHLLHVEIADVSAVMEVLKDKGGYTLKETEGQ